MTSGSRVSREALRHEPTRMFSAGKLISTETYTPLGFSIHALGFEGCGNLDAILDALQRERKREKARGIER